MNDAHDNAQTDREMRDKLVTDETAPTIDEFSTALSQLRPDGQAIISTAIDIVNQKRSTRVMAHVTSLVENIRAFDEAIKIAQHMRAETVKRVEAIKAGKFVVNGLDQIVFDETALNAPVIDPRYEGPRGRL